MAENKKIFSIFIVISILGALTEGLTVSFLVPIIDTLSGHNSFSGLPILERFSTLFEGYSRDEKLLWASSVLLVVFVLRGAMQFFVQYFTSLIPLYLEKRLSIKGYQATMLANLGFVNKYDSGTLQSQIYDIPQRVSNILFDFGTAIWTTMVLLVYVGFMTIISWEVTIITIVFVLIMSVILRSLTARSTRLAGGQLTVIREKRNHHTYESIFGMKLIRLVAAEKLMIDKFVSIYNDFIETQKRMNLIVSIPSALFSATTGVFICLLLISLSIFSEANTEEWLSQIFLFFFLMSRVLAPVSTLNVLRSRISSNMNAFDINEQFIGDAEKAVQKNGATLFLNLKDNISFVHVDFSYQTDDGAVIKDASFKINKGEMVAVVGPSGAGKTTITALLSRLYDPQSGRIMVDGVDLRELDLSQWRKRISVVSQDIVIFNDTVANNITFGRQGTDKLEIIDAAKRASADGFIESLPHKYDTMLGDHGLRLSGGQQQRIAIARAIISDPDLLILDEATSSLDSVTEREIQNAVEELSADRTVLIIAHRLSTVRKADKILVLEAGRLIEQGAHAELYASDGKYKEMIDLQMLDLLDDKIA